MCFVFFWGGNSQTSELESDTVAKESRRRCCFVLLICWFGVDYTDFSYSVGTWGPVYVFIHRYKYTCIYI